MPFQNHIMQIPDENLTSKIRESANEGWRPVSLVYREGRHDCWTVLLTRKVARDRVGTYEAIIGGLAAIIGGALWQFNYTGVVVGIALFFYLTASPSET